MTKKISYILFFIVQLSWAINPFNEGNTFYKQEKYNEAIKSYESILNSGKESVELYYNLGNAYYKLNKLAPAIYNYEKALLINPNDEETKNNLEIAKNRLIDDIKETPDVGFEKQIKSITSIFSYDGWAKSTVFFSILCVLFFALYLFSNKSSYKRLSFFSVIGLLLFVILSYFASIYKKNEALNDNPAIIFEEETTIKAEPRENATTSFVLHEGTKVWVLEKIDKWKKIKLTDDSEGWILENHIKEIKEY